MTRSMDNNTRGYERSDPLWHSMIDGAESVEDVVVLARDYVATLTPRMLTGLPEHCRPMRVKAEDDIEYWTYKLSATPQGERCDLQLLQDVFMHFLHASLRISQIHRARAGMRL
jgi:hypothetical protein